MDNVFIISQHRTGSTLLKNMLNAHSKVTMAFDEMNIFEPMRKNSLDKLIGNQIKTPEDFINAIENQEIYGTFWKEFQHSEIDQIALLEALKQEKAFNVDIILNVVLELLSHNFNTQYSGIKYPVHFSKATKLKQWFPKGKMIFLTRNPKAIIASKLNDPATKKRKQQSFLHRFGIHYFTLVYFCFEYKAAIKMFKQNEKDFFKLSYEELVSNQQQTLTKLCDFCELRFEHKMLQVGGKDSSYNQNKAQKPITNSVEKYKTVLSKFDQKLIELITANSYKKVKE